MLSAKALPDESRRSHVSPLCTNSILHVGNTYVGYENTNNGRHIQITGLRDDYYRNGELDYDKFLSGLVATTIENRMNLDRVNQFIDVDDQRIAIPYRSVLINTSTTRHKNQNQNTISINVRDALENIITITNARVNYVVFTYNLETKKGDSKSYSNNVSYFITFFFVF